MSRPRPLQYNEFDGGEELSDTSFIVLYGVLSYKHRIRISTILYCNGEVMQYSNTKMVSCIVYHTFRVNHGNSSFVRMCESYVSSDQWFECEVYSYMYIWGSVF